MIIVKKLSLRYHGASRPTLMNVDLHVKKGELVLISGPTGCGKSSLLNCLNGVLHHESSAAVTGSVVLDGHDIRGLDMARICRLAGTVFQNPQSQICTATPETEIAFGLENLAMDRPTMRQRINEALAFSGLKACRHQPASTLSGGQQQRLAIACDLALKPKVLFLDEPISQIDSQGANEILAVIHDLKSANDLAVILVEHRVEEIIPLADRVVLMDRGRIVFDGHRDAILSDLAPMRQLGLNVPHLADLFERLGRPERPLLAADAPMLEIGRKIRPPAPKSGEVICEIKQLAFGYGRHSPAIFSNLNLTLGQGDRVALMGSNGSGKTTLLHLLAEMLTPRSGTIAWKCRPAPSIGLVMQVPDLMLFSESVRAEVAFAPVHAGIHAEMRLGVIRETLSRMGLESIADQAPFALSRGQRLRTAVASILSMRPSILLLDEPTTGQDREQVERIMGELENAFCLVVFCTHDVDTAARHANRIVFLHDGEIVADGRPIDMLFDKTAMKTASIRQTGIQAFSVRHGIRALEVKALLAMLAPDGCAETAWSHSTLTVRNCYKKQVNFLSCV